jgi:hypothetical protein
MLKYILTGLFCFSSLSAIESEFDYYDEVNFTYFSTADHKATIQREGIYLICYSCRTIDDRKAHLQVHLNSKQVPHLKDFFPKDGITSSSFYLEVPEDDSELKFVFRNEDRLRFFRCLIYQTDLRIHHHK